MPDQTGLEINYGGETFERYRLQPESALTLDEAKAKFDGTFFHGINGIQAIFDDEGEVHEVLSFNLLNPNIPPKRYTEEPQGSFSVSHIENSPDKPYAAPLVNTDGEGKALMAIIESAKKDWQEWKATEAQHPRVDFRSWKAAKVQKG